MPIHDPELQTKFDTLKEDDFVKIAKAAYESVTMGKVQSEVLVNISQPDIMIFDPKVKPEFKFLDFDIGDKEIRVCIGLD